MTQAPGLPQRIRDAWRVLDPSQRLAAMAAIGLFATMFLPWYTKNTSAVVKGKLQKVDDTLIAWQAFSFVEAAVLLVAVATLVLLFARAERRGFHLPGGDGTVILGAGVWVCLLVFYRQLDKPNGSSNGQFTTDYGVTWGIFVTFIAGLTLAYAGWRIRTAHLTEPPLPAAAPLPPSPPPRRPREPREPRTAQTRVVTRERPGEPPVDGGEQLSFDE